MKVSTLSSKLTIGFSIIIILFLILFSSLLYFLFSSEIRSQYSNVFKHKLQLIDLSITKNFKQVTDLAAELRNNNELISVINNKENRKVKNEKVSSILYNYSLRDDFISSILIIDKNKIPYDSLYETTKYGELIKNNQDLDFFIKNRRYLMFSKAYAIPLLESRSDLVDKYTTCFIEFYDENSSELLGYLLINIDIQMFFYHIQNIIKDSFSTIYISNEKDDLLYQSGNINFDHYKKRNKLNRVLTLIRYENLFSIDNDEYITFEYPLSVFSNLKFIGIVGFNEKISNIDSLFNFTIALTLVIIILIVLFSNRMATKITLPIHRICESMKLIKERNVLPIPVDLKTESEIGALIHGFNQMTVNLNEMVEKIQENEKQTREYEVAKLQSQMDLLQSQMNPHFIHNTITAISYLSIKHGTEDISEMLRSFSLLLRASMSYDKKFITIKEEIEYVNGFLNLQKYRYVDMFTHEVNLPEELEAYIIPKLILQPIVENSLFHGIIPTNKKGKITISFSKEKESIKIIIKDNGKGIKEERLDVVMKKNKEKSKAGFNNIGLFNVNERLKLYYGNESQLQINSIYGKGVCTTIIIPIVNEF